MLCALPTFGIAGKAKFWLEVGENKDEIKMRESEKDHVVASSSQTPVQDPCTTGLRLAVWVTAQRPGGLLQDLEAGDDVNTHLSRLL